MTEVNRLQAHVKGGIESSVGDCARMRGGLVAHRIRLDLRRRGIRTGHLVRDRLNLDLIHLRDGLRERRRGQGDDSDK
jgi:hypothetical protein